MSKIRNGDRSGSRPTQNPRSEGRYERSGAGLCRQSDGLLLVIRERENPDGKRSPYLLVKDPVSGRFDYLSTLYRRASEFEDRASALRYRIEKEPDPRFVRVVCIGSPTRKIGIGV